MLNNLKKLGRYEIINELGRGGMGVVYKAIDPVLDRHVALKVGKISSSKASDETIIKQCLKEARLAAQFIHPNIAITYDAGFEKDIFYMALEYIEGEGLNQHIRHPKLFPTTKVLEIIYNVCYALEYIHQKGYIHLDIKPSNIMLTKIGEVKLMDFGIAKLMEEAKNEKNIAGSLHYMSPEHISPNLKLSSQTDIYSLGIVLYELLSANRPFEGENPYQILYKIANEEPIPIEKYVPDISHDLKTIISKAISKKKEDRFKTAKEFAEAFLPIIKGEDSAILDHQDRKKLFYLKQLNFFRHFQHNDLVEVLKISTWRFYKANSSIVEESDNDNNIYLFIQGKASIHLQGEIKSFKKGECFGESAILHTMPRQAKVITDTDCIVLLINATVLNQSSDSLQVKFLKEFYKTKMMQLVEANLKSIFKNKPQTLSYGDLELFELESEISF